jgi:homoserine O-acetyltransferase
MVTDAGTSTFESLKLDCGETLAPIQVAWETYGSLNSDKSNAILITHAFSGDAHAAGEGGWWSNMIGPGLAFDTDKYFVICSNVLGGCRGTTGPGCINPATARPWAMTFPQVTISDMVRVQKMLVDSMGIHRLLAVAGGSMGGMQALEWAVTYPESVAAALPIATTAQHSAQQIAFNEVGRQAIMADPDWSGGDYYGQKLPGSGLKLARMVGHITYMSDDSMREKFGRRIRDSEGQQQFEVESYLNYRGYKFVDRFDANSYIYITRAMDTFDLTQRGALSSLFEGMRARFLVISFTSDWLYPSYQSLEIASALRGRNCDVAYCNLESRYGHDAFLVEVEAQTQVVAGFLASTYRDVSGRQPRKESARESPAVPEAVQRA